MGNLDRMRKAAEKNKPSVLVPRDQIPPPQGGSGTAPVGTGKKPEPPRAVLRLPAGSEKVLKWDGQNWNGTLTIPGVPEPFSFQARNERGCFVGLHRMYENWLVFHKPEVPGEST